MRRAAGGVLLLLAVAGCATKPVQKDTPSRIVGTENNVRVDAEIIVDSSLTSVIVKYDVTNGRTSPIAIADMVPDTSFDPESRLVTVSFGSEVPGETLLPRLIGLKAGEKRSFSATAPVAGLIRRDAPFGTRPADLRVRVNFLGDTTPFASLVDIPEKAVQNPELADQLFLQWIELNETVTTNAIPLRSDGMALPPPADTSARRRN